MATTNHDESLLLGLPMELLQRITALVEDDEDTLHSIRLTCKTLDHATSDHFAEANFRDRSYCIFYKKSWIRLLELLKHSKRLMVRMVSVEFTTCLMGNQDFTALHVAPEKGEEHIMAQVKASKIHDTPESKAAHCSQLPGVFLMNEVLLKLKAKYRSVMICVDLEWNAESYVPPAPRDLLYTIATTGTSVRELKCARYATELIGRLQSNLLRSKLSSSFATIQRLTYTNVVTVEDRQVTDEQWKQFEIVEEVARRSRDLDSISVLSHGYIGHGYKKQHETLTTRLLSASNGANLRCLEIVTYKVDVPTLINALSGWKGSLTHLALNSVMLRYNGGDEWASVLRLLLSMPELQQLFLSRLITYTVGSSRLYVELKDLKCGSTTIGKHAEGDYVIMELQEKEAVTAALRELIRRPLAYW